MTEKKHTPGPWRVYRPGSCVPHYDICRRVVSDHPSGRTIDDDPSDADAHLIAAAPALLAAAKAAEHLIVDMLGHHHDNPVPKALREAVEQAEKGTP